MECEEGAESLLIGFVEGEVAESGRTFEEAGEGESELRVFGRIMREVKGEMMISVGYGDVRYGAKNAPEQSYRFENRTIRKWPRMRGHRWIGSQYGWTSKRGKAYMYPVMKQYAARGPVVCFGSTSCSRYCQSETVLFWPLSTSFSVFSERLLLRTVSCEGDLDACLAFCSDMTRVVYWGSWSKREGESGRRR